MYRSLAAYIRSTQFDIVRRKSVLNIVNTGGEMCFLWSNLAHLHPQQVNKNRKNTSISIKVFTKTKTYTPYAYLHIKRKHITSTCCFWPPLKAKKLTASLQTWGGHSLQITIEWYFIATTAFFASPKNDVYQNISHTPHPRRTKYASVQWKRNMSFTNSRTAWTFPSGFMQSLLTTRSLSQIGTISFIRQLPFKCTWENK